VTTLSVICITKNEERNITDCLRSVQWAHEIVVVDSGSTDATVSLARSFTDKIFDRPWDGYGEAKNFALSQCTGEWILWIDADERLSPELEDEIRSVLARTVDGVAGYSVPRKAFFLGKWIKHCGWYPGRVTRVFRRSDGRFTIDRVHEELVLAGSVTELKGDLLHYTDPDLFHYFRKLNKYTTLAAQDLAAEGRQFSLAQLIGKPFWTFVRMFIVKRGFLDGIHGFVLCILSSAYVFAKYAKLWEKNRLGIEERMVE